MVTEEAGRRRVHQHNSAAVERLILGEFQRELSPGRAPSSGRPASQERAASRDDPSHDKGRPRDDRRRQDVKRRQDGASCDEHRPDDDQRLQDPPTVTKRGYPITDVAVSHFKSTLSINRA